MYNNKKIITLEKADAEFGGKAYGLAFLKRNNLPVPYGFALNPEYVFKIANNLVDSKEEILELIQAFPKNAKLAIRSSALGEDGAEKSFAGVFDSKLNVKLDYENILNAIKEIYSGISTNKILSYKNDNEKIDMGIVIQEMIEPEIAGVSFTEALNYDGRKVVLNEFTEGLADKLVSGQIIPNRVIFYYKDDKTISTDSIDLSGKILNSRYISKLIPYIEKIKNNSDIPMDIEWCIDKNGKVWIVQARPITKEVFVPVNTMSQTTISSRGVSTSKTFVLLDDDEEDFEKYINNFPEGAILVANYTDTRYLPAMKKASGIITEQGSILSHASIVSRELEIPCIVGFANACKLYPTGTEITIDAINGKIISKNKTFQLTLKQDINWGGLFIFDNIQLFTIENTKILFEFTPESLCVHLPETVDNSILNSVEKFSREVFHTSPIICQTEKYLWYFEILRYKKLPFFNNLLEEARNMCIECNTESLNKYYENSFNLCKELVKIRDLLKSDSEKIYLDEIITSCHLILTIIIPEGLAIKESFMNSIQTLKSMNLNFTDLLDENIDLKSNKELTRIRNFIKLAEKKRNSIYEELLSIQAVNYDFFEHREERIKESLKEHSISYNSKTDNVIDVFYENLQFFCNISNSLKDKFNNFFYKKRKKKEKQNNF